jgi:hypothetical protein
VRASEAGSASASAPAVESSFLSVVPEDSEVTSGVVADVDATHHIDAVDRVVSAPVAAVVESVSAEFMAASPRSGRSVVLERNSVDSVSVSAISVDIVDLKPLQAAPFDPSNDVLTSSDIVMVTHSTLADTGASVLHPESSCSSNVFELPPPPSIDEYLSTVSPTDSEYHVDAAPLDHLPSVKTAEIFIMPPPPVDIINHSSAECCSSEPDAAAESSLLEDQVNSTQHCLDDTMTSIAAVSHPWIQLLDEESNKVYYENIEVSSDINMQNEK